MSEPAFDFMKVRTQSYEESGFRTKIVLLDELDSVVQRKRDVRSRIKVDELVVHPVGRWMEKQGFPSTITA